MGHAKLHIKGVCIGGRTSEEINDVKDICEMTVNASKIRRDSLHHYHYAA